MTQLRSTFGVRVTRPLTAEDREWVAAAFALTARTCQCHDVEERDKDGNTVRWFTWLEHCPVHSLTGARVAR